VSSIFEEVDGETVRPAAKGVKPPVIYFDNLSENRYYRDSPVSVRWNVKPR